MACFQPRGSQNDGQIVFPDSNRLPIRSFGREIQNIPDPRFSQRSQSIKAATGQQGAKLESDNFVNYDGGVKRLSPRKLSLNVKSTTDAAAAAATSVQNNYAKRLSSQIDNHSNQQPLHLHSHLPAQQPQQHLQQQQHAATSQHLKPVNMREVEEDLNTISIEDAVKPTLIAQYSRQIFDYMRVRENSFQIGSYMDRQMHISERMRAILVDWLVEAHRKFRLLPETLFMTVNIVDRYLDIATCTREKLQLVGVTALFIASKYEEIYPPPLKDFSELTQKAYSKAEILQMEGNIVCALKFNLTVPTSLRFLERYSRVERIDKRSSDMAQYLLELSLVDYKFVNQAESLKACAAIYLTNKLFKKPNCWTNTTAVHSQHSELQIRACALDLCMLLQSAPTSQTQAVRKKFLAPAFSEVATIQIEKINNNNTNNYATPGPKPNSSYC